MNAAELARPEATLKRTRFRVAWVIPTTPTTSSQRAEKRARLGRLLSRLGRSRTGGSFGDASIVPKPGGARSDCHERDRAPSTPATIAVPRRPARAELDCAGRLRSPATTSSFHRGRPPRNKGRRYPADPPTVAEIIAVMRATGERPDGSACGELRRLLVGLLPDSLDTLR
jgi:hypothetical protein